MKLINADKLAITPIDVTDLPQDRCLRVVLWEDVEKAETVDAIPAEWLLNHIPHDEVMEAYNKKLIEYLVIAWRKENER